MKTHNLFRSLRGLAYYASLLAVLGMFAPPIDLTAQTFTHNTTTLAAAQSATDTTVSLTAVTAATGSSFGAVQAGQLLVVDGELEQLVSVTATSTIWNVQRRGRLTSHASGAPVYIGPPGSFQATDPPPGTCVVASNPRFWINTSGGAAGFVPTGRIFTCSTSGTWGISNAPFFAGVEGGNGATRTLTAGDSGKTFLFDRAAGIVYTLPAPYPGMVFDFAYTVTITSNAATVVTNAGSVFIAGAINVTTTTFACNGTSHIKVTSNGTTTGGILGGHLRLIAVSSTLWQADGTLNASGTQATPCST